jgi:hypothetical protein
LIAALALPVLGGLSLRLLHFILCLPRLIGPVRTAASAASLLAPIPPPFALLHGSHLIRFGGRRMAACRSRPIPERPLEQLSGQASDHLGAGRGSGEGEEQRLGLGLKEKAGAAHENVLRASALAVRLRPVEIVALPLVAGIARLLLGSYRRINEGTFPVSRSYYRSCGVFWLATEIRAWQRRELSRMAVIP